MADREITHVRRDQEGTLTHLCHPGQDWSPVDIRKATIEIVAGYHRYYVAVDGRQVDVTIGYDSSTYCLRARSRDLARNYLQELPVLA